MPTGVPITKFINKRKIIIAILDECIYSTIKLLSYSAIFGFPNAPEYKCLCPVIVRYIIIYHIMNSELRCFVLYSK